MAIRIARGLFRLWIVLSVLWIVGVAVIARMNLPQEWPRTLVSVTPKPVFDPSKPYEVVPDSSDFERREAIKNTVGIALIPPTLLLIFGSALGWAIRGFK
jgi:hypothetical protein